jgi:tryptophan synthase alpha chain
MSRLSATFAALKGRPQPGLVAYVTGGDPDAARSLAIVRAIADAGADVIEIGVPFSDPIADGPVIQRAAERGLAAGMTLAGVLDLVTAVRTTHQTPVVLFTYVNPVLRMGTEAFVARAAEAGVDGVLLLDLPIEEAGPMRDALDAQGIDMVFLVSPTTTEARLRDAARLGRGFLYAISRLGVTGATTTLAGTARPVVERLRAVTDLPIALGFGISTPEHVQEVCAYADAAVVGSALVDAIARAPEGREAEVAGAFVRSLTSVGKGR